MSLKYKLKRLKGDISDFGLWTGFLWNFIWPILTLKDMLIERCARSWAYARFGWKNYDFDSSYLWSLMAFKLRRIQKALNEGIAIHEAPAMEALQQAIETVDRLMAEQYEDKHHEIHDEKWGPRPEMQFKGKRIKFPRRAKVITDADVEQERKEFMECYERAEADRLADIDKLNDIFKKHLASWWD